MEGTGDMNGSVEDTIETLHQRVKESDHSLQQESRNPLNSSTMLIPLENDWRDPLSSLMSPEVFTDTLEGKILVRSASSGAGTESNFAMNNAGVIVEELTLNNYNGTNLSRVGCSKNREEMSLKKSQGQWHNLFQLTDGFGNGVSRGEVVSKEPLMFRGEEAAGMAFLPKLWEQKSFLSSKPDEDQAEINRNLSNNDGHTVTSNTLPRLLGGIRTKVLPASGFPQFFVKNTLKGKGAIYSGNRAQPRVVMKSQNIEKETCDNGLVSDASQGSNVKANDLSTSSGKANGLSLCGGGVGASLFSDGTSLREWLKRRCRKINKLEALHIFRQVVELVDLAHSQGVALQDLRPSSFLILPSNRVKYVGSWASQSKMEFLESVKGQDMQYSENHSKRKKCMEQSTGDNTNLSAKRQKYNEHMKLVSHYPGPVSGYGLKSKTIIEDDTDTFEARYVARDFRELKNSDRGARTQNQSTILSASNQPAMLMVSGSVQLEERWYSCPDEINRSIHALSSNIYSLGVLLFELFCHFESWDVHAAVMSDLRHRILPPIFLSENPKEAGFCLWLLHPEPTFRPKTSEILQSELLSEVPDLSAGDQSSLAVDEDDAESELLLHFLLSLKEQKQKQASKLVEDLGSLRHDIDEVERRHSSKAEYPLRKHISSNGIQRDRLCSFTSQVSQMKEARLMKNIGQLEHAYFSTRSRIGLSEADPGMRSDIDVLKNPSRLSPAQNDNDDGSTFKKPTDPLGVFFEGICRYARYSKFEVKGTLRNGDLLNSPNVICSLSFDRDEEYFAAAGVSKKIKVFEFGSLLNDAVDIHYPVIEMSSKSKLSCVCWNSYIKNHLASTDYDGVVQLWDASTGQGFMRYTEHQKRAWSVDFSQVDPTKLASGSDDCSVKLWTINEEKCINTIRNVANVCCVQFSSHSTHLLAFGSADYKIYCYDIRNTRSPWCTLVGHGKAVSYVKFLDSDTLVSASTDNTLKLWDLNKTTSSGLSTNACSLTLSGHTNEKNFVGLSVSDGYIACGSETNEVYAYYRSLPMPITPHKFGSMDPISGQETGDDNGQFVSSVCWRGRSNMVVAANSTGSIKLLQLV